MKGWRPEIFLPAEELGAIQCLVGNEWRTSILSRQDKPHSTPIVEEVFLKERNDLQFEASAQVLQGFDAHEIGVPDLAIAVGEVL